MSRTATPSVVCLGLATLDVVHRVDEPPMPGRKGWATATELAAGGPAANAAVTAAHLLGAATLVTALGDDAAAQVVRADLAAHGVRVVDLGGGATPVASAVVTPDGERTVVSPGARTSAVGLTPAAREALAGAAVLLVDGHHPVAAADALAGAATAGTLTVLDAGSAKPHTRDWLPLLDVVAGSADYAAGLGTDADGAAVDALGAGARAVVMTDGAAPARWTVAADVATGGDADGDAASGGASGGASGIAAPPQVRAVDTLGAGDAFHGALAAALARGPRWGGEAVRVRERLARELPDAVSTACLVASRRVQVAGARAWLTDVAPLPSA